VITSISLNDMPRIREIEDRSYPLPWSDKMFHQEFTNPMGISFGWRTEDRLEGYIFGWIIFEDLHVNNVAVDPDARRHGIGSRLLEAVIAEASARGVERVLLEVRPSNVRARALYAKFGFDQVSVRPGYYEDTGEDGIILMARLTPSTPSPAPAAPAYQSTPPEPR
jgi:[ribosomal protein S18]-alanine N-acetyltransferase